MKNKIVTILGFTLFVVTSVFSAQRAANAYKTHKINRNSVIFSCEDEHEPTIKHFENTTLIVLTCNSANRPSEIDKRLDKEFPALPQ